MSEKSSVYSDRKLRNKSFMTYLQRIVIVTIIDFLPASPSLLNAIYMLAGAGYCIDLVGHKSGRWSFPEFPNSDVHFHSMPEIKLKIPGLHRLLHSLLTLYTCLKHRPIALLAVSQDGLIITGPVAVLLNLPMVYFSLEVRFPTDLKGHIRKSLEKFFFRFVKLTIIQDKFRAQTLLDSIGMKQADAEMVYVPNSCGLSPPRNLKGDYLRRRWNIPADHKIIISCGNLSDWTMAKELAQVAQSWPFDWTLVLHGWAEDQTYLEELRKMCDGRHVILSEEVVPYDQVGEMVSSADIGVALYKAVNRNIFDMGQSSGKIWQYLRCGLPVVTVDFPSLIQMVNDGQFGLCVHHPFELKSAIQQLISDKINFSNRAKDYYLRHGDFAMNFKPVLERLAGL